MTISDNKNIHNNKTTMTRVQVAQCKLLFTTNETNSQDFRELYKLRHHKEAYYPLACYYEYHGENEKAFTYFEKCQNNYRMALVLLKTRPKNQEKSLEYMILAANEGNKYAQYMLGLYFQHGLLVKQSIPLAKMWYQRSANQGLAEAQYATSNLLMHQGKEQNNTSLIQEALDYLSKAEIQENASALIRLGSLHEEGILVQQDYAKALDYYKRATLVPFSSSSICAFAHYLVGIYYQLGHLVGQPQENSRLAIKYLTISSHLGHLPAQRALGIMYAKGIGTEKNPIQSHILFQSAASKGDVRSLTLLAHTEHTFDLYQQAANAGSLSCQFALAILYQSYSKYELAFQWFNTVTKTVTLDPQDVYYQNAAKLMIARYTFQGCATKKNIPWAIKEIKTLSDQDYKEAHYWLATWYEDENNVEQAFLTYKKGADAGDVHCQFQFAYLLSNVKKNITSAFVWYLQAAKQGHHTAQYSIGLYYEKGLCGTKDIEKAMYWYTCAGEGGFTLAMVRLARLLNSFEESKYWLTKAIDLGDITALRELATFYKNGLIEGDLPQQQEAFDLFEKAADKNDAMSWHALSEFYEQGITVPVNLEKAVSCLEKGEALGYSVAGLDLADFYCRNNRIQEALVVYHRLTNKFDLKSSMGWKSRLGLSKLIIFEHCGTEDDQFQVYSWLIQMQSKREKSLAQVFELLGYCSENGIGVTLDRDTALHWYISCIEAKEFDWAKQRSLCRLINFYMDTMNYASAHVYLEMLVPYLDDMSQLSEDASIQACRIRYFLGYLFIYGLGDTEINLEEGILWLTLAADEGDLDAAYELGKYYTSINDEEEAKHRYEEGIGHAGCMRELALILLSEENELPDPYDEYDGGAYILDLLQMAANLDDIEAIYQLGLAHENGLGAIVPKNIEKALEFYVKAGNSMHELAMLKAGEILGSIMGKYPDSIYWFQKVVEYTNNIKAKVMLLSYDFQGHSNTEKDDAYHFKALQTLIHQEKDQHIDQLTRKEGLGLGFYILGQCFEIGRGTSIDLSMAKEWYSQSVFISQHIEAMWRLGFIYSTLEGDNLSALEWFRHAAEKGKHRDSHYQLGLFHFHGLGGLERNVIAAQKYFSKASDGGHGLAMFELARIVWSRHDDHIFGYELFKLAGKLDVPDALRELGHLYHKGFTSHGVIIVRQDYKKAFGYYCDAAQLGDSIAALMVGNYFEEGYLKEELGQDCERALQWYESAYRLNGGGLAELAIGKLKHTMADTIHDIREAEDMREEAFVWFESAANDSIKYHQVCAKVMVALYYINGWGRKQLDTKTGFEMLLKIAENGGSEAFVPVAMCYEGGIGTEYNMIKAIYYWEMAADMNIKDAIVRIRQIYDQEVDKETGFYNETCVRSKRNSGYSLDSMSSSSSSASSTLFSTHN